MKTISIKQPWAFIACSGIKDIENRKWATKFRGRVLVHASAKSYPLEVLNELQWNELKSKTFNPGVAQMVYNRSAIIGSVEIVDCVINHPSIWAERHNLPFKPHNWVLANPVLFAEPILSVKGKLSFWDYPMTEDEYLNRLKIGNPLSI